MPHFIVVGNEKGGAGKSTVSMHVSTALARAGKRIGVLDLDLRQRTLGRYIENRRAYCDRHGLNLPTPALVDLPAVDPASLADGENIYDKRLSLAISKLEETCNYILIDCPGSHSRLSQMAHSLANTLVTPMNDSYVDFDLLGRVDGETNKILGPSVYSEMVWHARQMRAEAGLKPIDWIVVHNRQGSQLMHNQRRIGEVLDALSKRIGFRVTNGLGERVVFRELFPKGLTLLDLRDAGVRAQLNLSNIAARQELRDLLKALKLPELVPEEA